MIRDHADAERVAEEYRQARDAANTAGRLRDTLADELRAYIRETGAEVDCPKARGKFVLERRKGRVVLDKPEAAIDAGYAHQGDDTVALMWRDWSDDEFEQYLAAIRRGVA